LSGAAHLRRRCHPPAAALQYVHPIAGPPGSSPSLYGSASWTLQSQCSSLQGGDGQGGCVGSVLLGDYLCRTSDASSFQVGHARMTQAAPQMRWRHEARLAPAGGLRGKAER
jgi:hypothetical protein